MLTKISTLNIDFIRLWLKQAFAIFDDGKRWQIVFKIRVNKIDSPINFI